MPAARAYCVADPVCSPVEVEDGTLCRTESPRVGTLGALGSAVAGWDTQTKLIEAAKRATPKLPPGMRQEFASLFSGQNLAILGGVLLVWAGSHYAGIGFIADALLLIAGAFTIGWQIGQVAQDLWNFVDIAIDATSEDDLERASAHLARAVVTVGVTVFIALIMKAGSRLRLRRKMTPASEPASATQRAPRVVKRRVSQPPPSSKTPQQIDRSGLEEWLQNNRSELAKDPARRASHLEGSDFSKPVVRKELPKGTKIIQYERVGGKTGHYAGYEGATPNELGIDGRGRVLKTYEVTKPMEIVESTAAPFEAGKIPGVGGSGGAQQISLPDGWLDFVKPAP